MSENRRFHLQVVTPEGKEWEGDVRSVQLPGAGGAFGVLAGHEPLLAALRPGVMWIENERYAVGGGFVEVRPDKVVVLAETFESATEVDVARAEEDLRQAKEKLEKATGSDRLRAQEAKERARARLSVARGNS